MVPVARGKETTGMELLQDWQIHTTRSKCAKPENTIAAICATLDARGMTMAGLSDHIDAPDDQARFAEIIRANRKDIADANPDCRVYVGAEASMLRPSQCALHADTAEQLDYVLVACNHYHLAGLVEAPASFKPESFASHFCDMVLGAADLGYADSVPHPFLNLKCGPELAFATLRCYTETRLAEVLARAAAADLAFEINPYHAGQAVEWFRDLVLEARRHGVKFTLGSDSHTLAFIGYPGAGNGIDPRTVCQEIGLRETDLKWIETGARHAHVAPTR